MALDNSKPESLADVLTRLADGSHHDAKRHKARVSAINRIASFLHRPPCDIPADVKALRGQLQDLHPAHCGVTAKSLSNIKSSLANALKATGAIPTDDRSIRRTAAWGAFLDHAVSDHQKWGLSRLIDYCCARSIEPSDVAQDVFDAYGVYLDDRLLTGSPAEHCKSAAKTWNHLVKKHELGLAKLEWERKKQYRARPLNEYPDSLQKEIDVYLGRLAQEDIFSENGPDKPLRPTSLRNVKAHLRQYLDALVGAGTPAATLTSLGAAISADQIKTAFRVIQKRQGTKAIPTGLANIAATLTAVAKHHLQVPEADLKAIQSVKKVVSQNPRGMSEKNANRLAQFNHWENVVLLVSLPTVLMDRANDSPVGRQSALDAMHAAPIAILLCCPMRVKNLAGLDLNRHLRPHLKGTHTIYAIRIEGTEVKNGQPIEVVLNSKMSRLLHRYITQFRPLVSNATGTALFPRRSDGAPRDPANFSGELIRKIKRETGLVVHTHLFRHLAAMLYLKQRPGDFETVRRLLKHKRLQTTMDFYANVSNQWAHTHYDDVVLSKFGGSDD